MVTSQDCLQKELIEYYYYWKKTPISTLAKNGRRPKSRKPGSKPATSSAGEGSSDSEEAETSESYTCFRCDTECKYHGRPLS